MTNNPTDDRINERILTMTGIASDPVNPIDTNMAYMLPKHIKVEVQNGVHSIVCGAILVIDLSVGVSLMDAFAECGISS